MHSCEFCGLLRRIYYRGTHMKNCLARPYFELIWGNQFSEKVETQLVQVLFEAGLGMHSILKVMVVLSLTA